MISVRIDPDSLKVNISEPKFKYYYNKPDKNGNLMVDHNDLTRSEFIKLTHIDPRSGMIMSDKDYDFMVKNNIKLF